MRGSLKGAVVGLLLVGGASVAMAAEERRLVLERQAGAEACPGASATEAAVAARLGYRPFSPVAKAVLAVRYRRTRSGTLVARIEIRGPQGEVAGSRQLRGTGSDCVELARRVELAIAIAIDPLASANKGGDGGDEGVPSFPPPASDEAPPPPPPEPPATQRSPAAARRPLRLSASLGGLLAVGSAPAVTGGFALRVRLGWHRWSVGLGGRLDLPAAESVPGGEVSAGVIAGELSPCYHLGPAAGCAVLLVGALRGSGNELVQAEDVTVAYVATGARLAWQIRVISRLSLALHADLLGALTRISLRETGTGKAFWTTPALSGAFGLAAIVRLF